MRKIQIGLALLVLLAVTTIAAGTARADTFTLDGVPLDSFAIIGAGNELIAEMATADASPYLTDLMLGTQIPLLTLDATFDMTGGPTINSVIEFFGNEVDSVEFEPGSSMLTSDVEFHYTTFTETTTVGTPAPEPSSLALLASGLFALVGFGRRKLRC